MSRFDAIVMGGSSGAIDALMKVLHALPRGFPVPVVVVVHVLPHKPSHLTEVLQPGCALTLLEAQDKLPLEPGTVVVGPPDYHLLVERGRHVALSVEPPVHFSRPSIDVLFESAAAAFGPRVLAVLLTGGSEDGVAGLESIAKQGGVTVVQHPKSAAVPVMPQAALRRFTPTQVLPLLKIGAYLSSEGGAA